ncbi:twinfilin actin binding protein isoform X2 [Oratosquilla oratoria]|uniref:twinfilin actin binding protein isoform X2 n=1 Tax=Oratosquilla oratoria TaxID=337810 RepID=UPI003F757C2B
MSHQTGITANKELLNFFGRCRNGSVRLFKVVIEDEALHLNDWKPPKGSWEDDYDSLVLPMVVDQQPCYILYRLDSQSNGGYEWVLISWSPDDSPTRQKMLYASTKATLKRDFGAAQIKDELFGTIKDDINLNGLKKHRTSSAAPAPLTEREEEMNEIKKLEVGVDIGVDSKHQTLAGVAFPIVSDGLAALNKFAKGELQYVQLRIDIGAEEIQLASQAASLQVVDLPARVPDNAARYHIYRYDHNYEGDFYHSVVFIYSMPGYACPIKERMLYSSSKNPITYLIENTVNVGITKKLEISEGAELTEEFLLDEIHPKRNLHRPKFAKPKGPANRGAKRLTKAPVGKGGEA